MEELKYYQGPSKPGEHVGVFRGKFDEGIDLDVAFDYSQTVHIGKRIFYVGRDSTGRIMLHELMAGAKLEPLERGE